MSKGLFKHTNGFTSIDNDIFYVQSRISPAAFSILIRIYRSSQGYSKPVVALSGVFLQKTTSMTKNTVSKAVKELEAAKLILVKRRARLASYFQVSIKGIIELAKEVKDSLTEEPEVLEMELEGEEPTLDEENKEEESTETGESEQDNSFEIFWCVYDKKVSRSVCKELWDKLAQEEKKELMQTLGAYVESTSDKQYRKDPANYLKNKCWEDEVVTSNVGYKAPVTNTQTTQEVLPQYRIDSPVTEEREVLKEGSEADRKVQEFLNRYKSKGETYVN
jgi:phage replication O-like protein O